MGLLKMLNHHVVLLVELDFKLLFFLYTPPFHVTEVLLKTFYFQLLAVDLLPLLGQVRSQELAFLVLGCQGV